MRYAQQFCFNALHVDSRITTAKFAENSMINDPTLVFVTSCVSEEPGELQVTRVCRVQISHSPPHHLRTSKIEPPFCTPHPLPDVLMTHNPQNKTLILLRNSQNLNKFRQPRPFSSQNASITKRVNLHISTNSRNLIDGEPVSSFSKEDPSNVRNCRHFVFEREIFFLKKEPTNQRRVLVSFRPQLKIELCWSR